MPKNLFWCTQLVVIAALVLLMVPERSVAENVQAKPIADLMNRFGVVTFSSTKNNTNLWGSYPSDYTPASVIAAYRFLTGSNGLKLVFREYHYSGSFTAVQQVWLPEVYAATGGKFSVCIGAGGGLADVSSLLGLASNSSSGAGYIEFVEGVNEPNQFGTTLNQTLLAQEALFAGVSGLSGPNPPQLALPSIAVTSTPITTQQENFYVNAQNLATINGQASYANAHIYPQIEVDLPSYGSNNGTLEAFFQSFNQVYGNKPQIITEWHPTLFASDSTLKVNATYDSYWTPLFILRAYFLGYQRFYWYALFDFANTYFTGLFPRSGYDTPRQVAYVVRAMYTLTGDSGSDQLTFTPGSLDYVVTGLPGPVSAGADFSGGHHALFQNSSGTFFLYVWNAQMNPGGQGNLTQVAFNTPIQSATLYRVSDSSSPAAPTTSLQTVDGSSPLSFNLDANVYLIVITAPSGTTNGGSGSSTNNGSSALGVLPMFIVLSFLIVCLLLSSL